MTRELSPADPRIDGRPHTIVGVMQMVEDVRSTLWLMWGGALFVLLIGCLSVANLVLVRSCIDEPFLTWKTETGTRPLEWPCEREPFTQPATP